MQLTRSHPNAFLWEGGSMPRGQVRASVDTSRVEIQRGPAQELPDPSSRLLSLLCGGGGSRRASTIVPRWWAVSVQCAHSPSATGRSPWQIAAEVLESVHTQCRRTPMKKPHNTLKLYTHPVSWSVRQSLSQSLSSLCRSLLSTHALSVSVSLSRSRPVSASLGQPNRFD